MAITQVLMEPLLTLMVVATVATQGDMELDMVDMVLVMEMAMATVMEV